MILKKLVVFVLTLIILGISPILGHAASPTFFFYPQNGSVRDSSKGFTVDILIDSAGERITKARLAVTFDPTKIQVVKANRNNTLFDQWPEDESTIDNRRGMVMLTGFTQSGGTKSLYMTEGEPDVMARLEFEVITEEKGEILLNFEYSGSDDLFKSVIMKEGSPPQNVLASQPESAKFALRGFTSPSTAIEPSHLGIVAGFVLIAVGIFISNSKVSSFRKRKGTVVLYE